MRDAFSHRRSPYTDIGAVRTPHRMLMSAFDCGFNRSMQHTEGCFGSRSVAYEVPDKDLLHPKTCKLARHRAVARQVAASLQQRWSPQQIAGWLKRIHPDDANGQVSHETIYRTLFIQARGAGRGDGRRRRRCSRASDHDLQLASSRTRCTRSSPSASQACSSTYHVPPTFRPGTLPLRSPHKGDFAGRLSGAKYFSIQACAARSFMLRRVLQTAGLPVPPSRAASGRAPILQECLCAGRHSSYSPSRTFDSFQGRRTEHGTL